MSFFDTLKNIFILLIFIQFTPLLVSSIRTQYNKYLKPHTKVGLITINGILDDSTRYNHYLRSYFQDPDIKAIVLKMECPGGAAGTSQAIYHEITMLKKEFHKPIIVLVENVCASGGYYIAAATDYIIAPGTALIGSIGSYIPDHFHLKEFIEQYKIKYSAVKAGMYKGVGDPFVDTTPQETALLQSVVNDTYQQFATDIALSRKLASNALASWADGKVFSGRQALQLGLIDEIGSAYTALKVIKEKALIEGEIEWVHPPHQSGLLNLLTSSEPDEPTLVASVTTSICTYLENRLSGLKVR